MKEIGEKLKETRESIGISIDEAAEDLKMRPKQIEDLEAGNTNSFKDVFYLKYFIRDYSKYLGLDYDDMVDEFNEYLFDYTSKISVNDIKKAKKKLKKKEKANPRKIVSPYTLERRNTFVLSPFVTYGIIVLLLLIIGYCFVSLINHDDFVPNTKGNGSNIIK